MDTKKIDRLDILLKGKQIDQEIFLMLNTIKKELGPWDEDKKWRFLTHAAIALGRVKKQQPTDMLDIAIIEDIQASKHIKEAHLKYETWFGNFSLEIPVQEKWYLFIHILSYIEEKKWK